ncbi:MAG: dienelactone hydrolase family protein [Alphaproteobacteria bacterium]
METVTTTVGGSEMEMLVFRPAGEGPFPAVIAAQHLPVAHAGLETDPFTIAVGERLAAAGYVCLIPFLFHWWPKDEDIAVKRDGFRDDRTVADLQAAWRFLENDPGSDADRIGLIGHCWGGRVAWLGACHLPQLKAMVMLYGGRIRQPMGPATTAGAVAPITLAKRIPCPVMGIFGNEDQNPSPEDVDALDEALTTAGVSHFFHRYDGAGHGFQDFTNPERFRKAQSEDSWGKIDAFLAAQLKTRAGT